MAAQLASVGVCIGGPVGGACMLGCALVIAFKLLLERLMKFRGSTRVI